MRGVMLTDVEASLPPVTNHFLQTIHLGLYVFSSFTLRSQTTAATLILQSEAFFCHFLLSSLLTMMLKGRMGGWSLIFLAIISGKFDNIQISFCSVFCPFCVTTKKNLYLCCQRNTGGFYTLYFQNAVFHFELPNQDYYVTDVEINFHDESSNVLSSASFCNNVHTCREVHSAASG